VLIIPGNLQPAPRMTRRSKFVSEIAKRYLTQKETIQWLAKQAKLPLLYEGNISISIRFYFNDKRQRDLDNLMKSVTDALNGIAYKDDSQITIAVLAKYKDNIPRTEVEISEA